MHLNLARVLDPHIDWQIPAPAVPEVHLNREWFAALVVIAVLSGGIWILTTRVLPVFCSALSVYQRGEAQAWLGIWINAPILIFYCAAIMAALSHLVGVLSLNPRRRRQSTKVMFGFIGLLTLAMGSRGLGNLIYYQFFSLGGGRIYLTTIQP
jgi:hypothetical protein